MGDTDYNGLWTGDDWDSPIGKTLSFILQWKGLIKHSFNGQSLTDSLSGKGCCCFSFVSHLTFIRCAVFSRQPVWKGF